MVSSPRVKGFSGIVLNLSFVVLSIVCLLPFYWVFVLGTNSTRSIMTGFPVLPGNSLVSNLNTLIYQSTFVRAFFNSVMVSASNTFLTLLVSVCAGYAFAKYTFAGKNILFYFVLATMMLPSQMGVVGYLKEVQHLHLYNTLIPLILSVASGFGVFWMKQYIQEYIHTEMLEAARIDGAGEIDILFRLVLPNIGPAIASYGIIVFVSQWNSFLMPLIVLSSPNTFTLPLVISSLQGRHDIDYGAQFLGASIATLPLFIFFIVASRRVISSLATGAVKG